MEIKYIADDGKEFKSYEEYHNYELMEKFKESNITMLNDVGITTENFKDAFYVSIPTDDELECLSVTAPEFAKNFKSAGKYYYDGYWYDLNGKIESLKCKLLYYMELSNRLGKSQPNSSEKWVLTDPDDMQYRYKLSPLQYQFIEIREGIDDYYVCIDVVDYEDYSLDQIKSVVESYYNSIDDVFINYGVENSLQIIAECLFEQTSDSDLMYCFKYNNREAAEKHVEKFIKEN